MKKPRLISIVVLVMAVAMTCALFACGSSGSSEAGSSGAAAVEAQSGSLMSFESHATLDASAAPTKDTCLTCHSLDSIREATVEVVYDTQQSEYINPHESPHDTIRCEDCHSMVGQSVLICAECHVVSEYPDGWIPYSADMPKAENAA